MGTFSSEFSSYMESVILSKDQLINLDDFNTHMDVSTDAEDLETFKRLKNHVTYISNKARRDFYADFISENGGDQGSLFSATLANYFPS